MPQKIYEAWASPDTVMLCPSDVIRQMENLGQMHPEARLMYSFSAATGEEAGAIHSLRQGFRTYTAPCEAAPCPQCGANYYPDNSGECWRCG
jgi:hypothetical protein